MKVPRTTTALGVAACLALAAAGCGSSASSSSTSAGGAGASTSAGANQSIQTYGSEASGSEKDAVIAAMRSFLGALAGGDYAKVCDGITSENRASLQQFAAGSKQQRGKGCAAMLGTLLTSETSAARKAANGTVTHVRIGGDNAFILFRPAGGGPLSYFVMKQEDGDWKSTSLATGTPLNPTSQ